MTARLVRRAAGIVLGLAVLAVGLIFAEDRRLEAGAQAYKSEDDARALHILRPLAMVGDPRAQLIIADMYAFGLGVAKNDSETIYWLRRAAFRVRQGEDPVASGECAIGESYANGFDAPIDTNVSVRWLRLAARGGSTRADSLLRAMHKAPYDR